MQRVVWDCIKLGAAVIFVSFLSGCSAAIPAIPLSDSTPFEGGTVRSLASAGVGRNADWTMYLAEQAGIQMALVPAGCFPMGRDDRYSDAQPAHRVCFEQPFWIDAYEVTQSQFEKLGGQAGAANYFTGADLPRENISWAEADDFCRLRGARLPTEAEWEYATRGPDGLLYPWGDEFVPENAVYFGNSEYTTWKVGSRPGGRSWVGAYDLSGNVREWVADWYAKDYYGTLADGAVNPQGPENGEYKMIRGGSWFVDDFILRATDRGRIHPSFRMRVAGFRCALSTDFPSLETR